MTPKEALERMINNLCNDCGNRVCSGGNKECFWFNLYKKVETALNRLEELEKVLKIIKEKEVSISAFRYCLGYGFETKQQLKLYNNQFSKNSCHRLTEIEFNLLKEYLK